MAVRIVWGITEVAGWTSGWSKVDQKQTDGREDSLV